MGRRFRSRSLRESFRGAAPGRGNGRMTAAQAMGVGFRSFVGTLARALDDALESEAPSGSDVTVTMSRGKAGSLRIPFNVSVIHGDVSVTVDVTVSYSLRMNEGTVFLEWDYQGGQAGGMVSDSGMDSVHFESDDSAKFTASLVMRKLESVFDDAFAS